MSAIEWIQSGGGPLVVVPESELKTWSGTKRRLGGVGSDYGRACEVVDEIGVLSCGQAQALVLGDEPHRSAWIAREYGGLIVRWVYADSEGSVMRAVENFSGGEVAPALTVALEGKFWLFDAAEPGEQVFGKRVAFSLQSGIYEIGTTYVSPNPEVRLLVHPVVLSAAGKSGGTAR